MQLLGIFQYFFIVSLKMALFTADIVCYFVSIDLVPKIRPKCHKCYCGIHQNYSNTSLITREVITQNKGICAVVLRKACSYFTCKKLPFEIIILFKNVLENLWILVVLFFFFLWFQPSICFSLANSELHSKLSSICSPLSLSLSLSWSFFFF